MAWELVVFVQYCPTSFERWWRGINFVDIRQSNHTRRSEPEINDRQANKHGRTGVEGLVTFQGLGARMNSREIQQSGHDPTYEPEFKQK